MDSFIEFHCSIEQNFTCEKQMIRGFTCHNYAISPHTHDFYEINIITKGSGVHTLGNNFIEAKLGDVFVMPPKSIHSYTKTENLDVYHLLIKPEFINALFKQENDAGLRIFLETEPLLRENISKNLFLSLNVNQMIAIKPDLDSISEPTSKIYPDTIAFKNYTALKMLYWFSYLITEQNSTTKLDVEIYILKVIDYIYENYMNTITIDQLCHISCMSKATLFRKFKLYCNCTPMEFIRNCRKSHALKLIEANEKNKTNIAQECGFYDLSHMKRIISEY